MRSHTKDDPVVCSVPFKRARYSMVTSLEEMVRFPLRRAPLIAADS
jgi:hypothetical protein